MAGENIFDAFMSVSKAVQGTLEVSSDLTKKIAHRRLAYAQLADKEAFNDFVNEMHNSGDWEHWEEKWNSFKTETYNRNSSKMALPYAKRLYDLQFKEAAMQTEMSIRVLKNNAMREQMTTSDMVYLEDIVNSNAYIPKTIVNEDGSEASESVLNQKISEIFNTIKTMKDDNRVSPAQAEQLVEKYTQNVFLKELVQEGIREADSNGTLKDVRQAIEKKSVSDESFITPSGKLINFDTVKEAAYKQAEAHFYKLQKQRWEYGERTASKIYEKKMAGIREKNVSKIKAACEEGQAFIKAYNNKYNDDGFSVSVKEEYINKFMFDEASYKKGGSGGFSSSLSYEEELHYYVSLLKNGIKNPATGQVLRPSVSDIFKQISSSEAMNERIAAVGFEKATARVQKLTEGLKNYVLKGELCSPNLKSYVKDIDGAFKNAYIEKFGEKKLKTSDGFASFNEALGTAFAQVAAYLEQTPSDKQDLNPVKTIIVKSVLGLEKNANTIQKTSWFEVWKPKEEAQAVDLAKHVAQAYEENNHGEDITGDNIKEAKESLKGYAVQQLGVKLGLAEDKVASNYIVEAQNDGSVLFLDAKTKNPAYKMALTESKDGKAGYKIHTFGKGKTGKSEWTLDAKTPEQQAGERKQQRKDEQEFYKKAPFLYLNEASGDLLPASQAFKAYTKSIPYEHQKLFTAVKDRFASNALLRRTSKTLEHTIKTNFEALKDAASKFEKEKENIGEIFKDGSSGQFYDCYNGLREPLEKSLFAQAFYQERKKSGIGNVSLLSLLRAFKRSVKEWGVADDLSQETVNNTARALHEKKRKNGSK